MSIMLKWKGGDSRTTYILYQGYRRMVRYYSWVVYYHNTHGCIKIFWNEKLCNPNPNQTQCLVSTHQCSTTCRAGMAHLTSTGVVRQVARSTAWPQMPQLTIIVIENRDKAELQWFTINRSRGSRVWHGVSRLWCREWRREDWLTIMACQQQWHVIGGDILWQLQWSTTAFAATYTYQQQTLPAALLPKSFWHRWIVWIVLDCAENGLPEVPGELVAVWYSSGLVIGRLQVWISAEAISHHGLLSFPSLRGW